MVEQAGLGMVEGGVVLGGRKEDSTEEERLEGEVVGFGENEEVGGFVPGGDSGDEHGLIEVESEKDDEGLDL